MCFGGGKKGTRGLWNVMCQFRDRGTGGKPVTRIHGGIDLITSVFLHFQRCCRLRLHWGPQKHVPPTSCPSLR